MLGRGWLWVGLLAAFVVGCGGGDDDDATASTTSGLAGVYETLSDDHYQPCDGPPVNTGNEPPYFTIVDGSFLGAPFMNVYRCTSGDPSSCDNDETGAPFIFLAQETSGGAYRAESSYRSGGGGTDCSAGFTADDIKKSGDGVTLTSEERSGEWSGTDCTADFDEALVNKTKSLPCFQREIRVGRLVPPG